MSFLFKPRKIAVIFSCLAIIGFLSVYLGPRTKTQYQVDYEDWLAVTLVNRQNLILKEAVPPQITVSLSSTASGGGFSWIYKSSNEQQSEEQLQRILTLIRDADLLALGRAGLSDGPYKLEVSSDQKKFSIYFSESDVENNLRAQNLFKLLQVYALNGGTLGGSQLAKSENSDSGIN